MYISSNSEDLLFEIGRKNRMPKAKEGENELPSKGVLDINNLFSVTGKICLVTGGGSGIGAMIAAGLVNNGAKVYIASRKDTSSYAEQLTSRGTGTCHSMKIDLSNDESINNFIKQFNEVEPNGLDVLINNSGTNWVESIDKYSIKGWDKVYALNVRSVFLMSKLFIPSLEKRGTKEDPSRILNISSIEGEKISESPAFAYNSGKAAVTHLSRHLAAHLAHRNINVNAICPGFFPSRLTREFLKTDGNRILETIPIKRFGNVQDMVALSIYLSSKGSSWVTGTKFILDGGQTLQVDLSQIAKL